MLCLISRCYYTFKYVTITKYLNVRRQWSSSVSWCTYLRAFKRPSTFPGCWSRSTFMELFIWKVQQACWVWLTLRMYLYYNFLKLINYLVHYGNITTISSWSSILTQINTVLHPVGCGGVGVWGGGVEGIVLNLTISLVLIFSIYRPIYNYYWSNWRDVTWTSSVFHWPIDFCSLRK